MHEALANIQLARMYEMIGAQENRGGLWSIENPLSSFIWSTTELSSLRDSSTTMTSDFAQCVFKLRPPDYLEARRTGKKVGDLRTRKYTRILSNIPRLCSLSVKCDGNHDHVTAMGSCRCKGKTVKRSVAAGAYPKSLCNAWAQCVHTHLESIQQLGL